MTYKVLMIISVLLFSCGNSVDSKKVQVVNDDSLSIQQVLNSETIWPKFIKEVPSPHNFDRVSFENNSFSSYFRQLPLKPADSPVLLYNGQLKGNQTAHYAVVDLPIGKRDLHQCADAVMRLKAEYHFQQKEYEAIHFNYTSGDEVRYEDWVRGKRPSVSGNRVTFSMANQAPDYSYTTFWKYLENIFTYAGTASLTKELQKVDIHDIQIGDVFIQGGFPGHAVIVVDMVKNQEGEKLFMLAQSYMPAQELQILRNPLSDEPWYSIPKLHEKLVTPEWIFASTDLKRFP